MGDLIQKLAKRLKSLQGTRTQREFAKDLGIDVATLNRLYQRRENITISTIQRICNNLKCKVGWLFLDED